MTLIKPKLYQKNIKIATNIPFGCDQKETKQKNTKTKNVDMLVSKARVRDFKSSRSSVQYGRQVGKVHGMLSFYSLYS